MFCHSPVKKQKESFKLQATRAVNNKNAESSPVSTPATRLVTSQAELHPPNHCVNPALIAKQLTHCFQSLLFAAARVRPAELQHTLWEESFVSINSLDGKCSGTGDPSAPGPCARHGQQERQVDWLLCKGNACMYEVNLYLA